MKDYLQNNKKGLIIVLGAIAIALVISIVVKPEDNFSKKKMTYTTTIINQKPNVISEIEKIETLLAEKTTLINFYADTFKIDQTLLTNFIKADYQKLDLLNENTNWDLAIINYLFSLENTNPNLFNNEIIPNSKNKEYIVGLISYFTKVYPIVDFKIASSIAQIESGFSAVTMMNCNNVFGGFAGGRLISYKNIEYGILSYIKMLNDSYFSQGLTTIETIGNVYNPTINESGVKIAKPSWVSKVYNNLNTYVDYEYINTIDQVNSLKQV